jgi:hypothetical protein
MSGKAVPIDDLPDTHTSGMEVPPEDLHSSGDEVPVHDLPQTALQEKYSTPGQQALTMGENFIKGAVPFAAQYGENKLSQMGVPGLSPEDQEARAQANPNEASWSKIGGNLGFMAAAPEVGGLAKVGSMALNSAVQMGIMSGSDEYSKSLMGHADSTPAVAAHIIGSSIAGGLGGLLIGKTANWLEGAEEQQAGSRLQAALAGFAHHLKFGTEVGEPSEEAALLAMSSLPENSPKVLASFQYGQKMAQGLPGKIVRGMGDVAGGMVGSKIGHEGLGIFIADKLFKTMGIEKPVNKYFAKAGQKYLGPALLKIAQSGKTEGLAQALDYAGSVGTGAMTLDKGLNYLFNAGANETMDFVTTDKQRDAIKSFLDNGGVNTEVQEDANKPINMPMFAGGGEVIPSAANLNKPNAVADHWPEQNILISATRGRLSQYLTSKMPQKQNSLLFDTHHKDPLHERTFNQTLNLVNKPMSVFKHIKEGTLLPGHVDAIKSIFPEMHAEMSNRIMRRLMKDKLKAGKKLPYHTRQSLSLFLGGNTDSTLTQPNIAAAQSVFMMQNAQQAQVPKKEASLSKIGEQTMTPEQGRERRLNKN